VRNFKIIVFLGVDGSGKSTLIDTLSKSNQKKYKKIHFMPDYFRKKNKPSINPHKQSKRSEIFSYLKIIYWLINFYFFRLINFNSKKIFIFDRYIYDVIIDPLRYRITLSKKIKKIILKFSIKPDVIFFLIGNPNKIYYRKKELKLKTITRLNNDYLIFSKKLNNKLVLNCSHKVSYNKKEILNFLKKPSIKI